MTKADDSQEKKETCPNCGAVTMKADYVVYVLPNPAGIHVNQKCVECGAIKLDSNWFVPQKGIGE